MNSQKKYKFLISGGGTGGHIFPAISIADELKRRYKDAEILFVGARDRMEMEKIPKAGYKIEGLWISGIQRKISLRNLSFPFKVLSSILKSKRIVKNFKPDVAIGTGGYASGPALYAANQAGIPCLIQEQNSYAGITNKILSKKVDKICVAYNGMERYFPKEKILLTGNPIRQDLLKTDKIVIEAKDSFGLKHGMHTLLVLGGSLGARNINRLIESRLKYFEKEKIQVIWQCGKLYYQEYRHYGKWDYVQVYDFLNDMDVAYAAADFIISRAGASSVSELCVVGKPVIFIPSPNVAEDHQTKNANAIADENAAILIKESDLEIEFEKTFTDLIQNKELQKKLSTNIKNLAKIDATKDIVNEIVKLIKT